MYELAIRRKLPNGREVFADVNRSGGLPGAIAGTAARHIGVAGAEDAIRPNPGAYPNPSPNAAWTTRPPRFKTRYGRRSRLQPIEDKGVDKKSIPCFDQ
jgi:hypothetical protein